MMSNIKGFLEGSLNLEQIHESLNSIVANNFADFIKKAHRLKLSQDPVKVNNEYVINFTVVNEGPFQLRIVSSSNSVDIKVFRNDERKTSQSFRPDDIRDFVDQDFAQLMIDLMNDIDIDIRFDNIS